MVLFTRLSNLKGMTAFVPCQLCYIGVLHVQIPNCNGKSLSAVWFALESSSQARYVCLNYPNDRRKPPARTLYPCQTFTCVLWRENIWNKEFCRTLLQTDTAHNDCLLWSLQWQPHPRLNTTAKFSELGTKISFSPFLLPFAGGNLQAIVVATHES